MSAGAGPRHPACIAVVLLAAGLLAPACILRQPTAPDVTPTLERPVLDLVFDSMVDRHLEAGYEDPRIDPGDPLLAARKIVVTATVNERTAKDLIARLLLLDEADPDAPIDLYITTQGGWYDTTFAVIDTMHSIRAPVNTHGIGGVYSAGAMILAAGTGRRQAARGCMIMVHANGGDPSASREGALEAARIEAFWRRHARLPRDWYPMHGDVAYYLSADEALAYGVVDSLVGDVP